MYNHVYTFIDMYIHVIFFTTPQSVPPICPAFSGTKSWVLVVVSHICRKARLSLLWRTGDTWNN